MSNSLRDLGLEHLTPQERILLADELLTSISDETCRLELTPEHLQDLKERLRFREENPEPSRSWEEIQSRLRGNK